MSDIGDWLKSIPLFTRYWFISTIVVSLLGRFQFIYPQTFMLLYEPFVYKFEIWRSLTSVLYYPTNFNLLINLYFLYQYSSSLEKEEYARRPADYLYLLIFNWVVCIASALMLKRVLLMECMLLSVIYIWCQLNKNATIRFWFGKNFINILFYQFK